MIKVIHGQLYSEDFSKLEQLAADYNSCVRWCYVKFKQEDREFNDVRNLAKEKYTTLNTRQISDAVVQGQALSKRNKDKKVVFGGKKLLQRLKAGLVTKQQWKDARDGQIYARGDKTKTGNPNLRVVGDQLRITVGNRKFEHHKLFIPEKFQLQLADLLASGEAYNVRLKKQDEKHWRVLIDYEVETPIARIDFVGGAIGVDTNVDRIAIAEITKDGNYIDSQTLVESRLQHGSTEKRLYDIACLVKQVIEIAKEKKKGIVFENLQFKKEWTWSKKNNRVKANFVWRKFLELLECKCVEHGIAYKKVNPAYTSVIGKVKYKEMYGITTHEAAAFVIARRGLGFNEKVSVRNCEAKRVKQKVMGTLGEKYDGKKVHSWVLWSKIKAVLTGLRSSMRDLEELRDHFRDDSESLSGEVFLQELVAGSDCVNNFGSGRTTLRSGKILQLC